jgi:hypothetical protein
MLCHAVAYIVFAVIATIGVGFPVAMFLALGERRRGSRRRRRRVPSR